MAYLLIFNKYVQNDKIKYVDTHICRRFVPIQLSPGCAWNPLISACSSAGEVILERKYIDLRPLVLSKEDSNVGTVNHRANSIIHFVCVV